MKIALVPFNPTVGLINQNTENIMKFTDQAIGEKCHLIIFPELSLIGYPPKDYLYYNILHQQQSKALVKLT